MDTFEKDWKFEIYHSRSSAAADDHGFQKKYVPKSSIMSTDPKAKGRNRKSSSRGKEEGITSYMYMKKTKTADDKSNKP